MPFDDSTGISGYDTVNSLFAIRLSNHALMAYIGGEDPEIGSDTTLNTTELIFDAWESARQRRRIEFPLDTEGNALAKTVEDGELSPS